MHSHSLLHSRNVRMNASECARMHLTVGPDHHLDTVIVSAGKTVDQIKMMHILEKQKHAEACNKNRSITAQSVNELATKWGCPSEHKTKYSKLGWMFLNKL